MKHERMMKRLCTIALGILLLMSTAAQAQDTEWTPVTGAETLQGFMSGLKAERTLSNGDVNRAEYHADGTGTLYSWGAAIPRIWSIKDDDQLCFTAANLGTRCYQLEQNSAESDLYRVRDVVTGTLTEFRVIDDRAVGTSDPRDVGGEGGAAAASASELAAELSNPNSAVATMNLKNQFRVFSGDLPKADDQWSYTLLFQPALPFVLGSGSKIFWRPAVPLLVDQPAFDPATGEFSGETGLGDIPFDLAYAPTLDNSSLLVALGLITSLPTATTSDLGSGRWTLGPEFLIGYLSPKHVLGLFPNHQWDIAGWSEADINLTTIQAFYTYLPGGGWSVGTGPTMTYDWESEQWTVPLQINAGKTVVWNSRPWKLSAELNYYVEKPEAIGPEWMLGLNIAPVVKNKLAGWFGLGDD
ncbi:MAG: hypothetical protein GY801_13180 [bacterium]|nr:hypothetical protein [bacterium]